MPPLDHHIDGLLVTFFYDVKTPTLWEQIHRQGLKVNAKGGTTAPTTSDPERIDRYAEQRLGVTHIVIIRFQSLPPGH